MPGDIDDILAAEEDELNLPSIHGKVFKASCKLLTIFAPVAGTYYRRGINMSKRTVSLDYGEKAY